MTDIDSTRESTKNPSTRSVLNSASLVKRCPLIGLARMNEPSSSVEKKEEIRDRIAQYLKTR